MTRHTTSPQPQAVEDKDKRPTNERKTRLAGGHKRGKNKNNPKQPE